jgi:hypothetical protein
VRASSAGRPARTRRKGHPSLTCRFHSSSANRRGVTWLGRKTQTVRFSASPHTVIIGAAAAARPTRADPCSQQKSSCGSCRRSGPSEDAQRRSLVCGLTGMLVDPSLPQTWPQTRVGHRGAAWRTNSSSRLLELSDTTGARNGRSHWSANGQAWADCANYFLKAGAPDRALAALDIYFEQYEEKQRGKWMYTSAPFRLRARALLLWADCMKHW